MTLAPVSSSIPRCNGWLFDCVHEWHVLAVGLCIGLLAVWLRRRSPFGAALFTTAALWLAVTESIHGIRKPWYLLGGTAAVVLAATLLTRARALTAAHLR